MMASSQNSIWPPTAHAFGGTTNGVSSDATRRHRRASQSQLQQQQQRHFIPDNENSMPETRTSSRASSVVSPEQNIRTQQSHQPEQHGTKHHSTHHSTDRCVDTDSSTRIDLKGTTTITRNSVATKVQHQRKAKQNINITETSTTMVQRNGSTNTAAITSTNVGDSLKVSKDFISDRFALDQSDIPLSMDIARSSNGASRDTNLSHDNAWKVCKELQLSEPSSDEEGGERTISQKQTVSHLSDSCSDSDSDSDSSSSSSSSSNSNSSSSSSSSSSEDEHEKVEGEAPSSKILPTKRQSSLAAVKNTTKSTQNTPNESSHASSEPAQAITLVTDTPVSKPRGRVAGSGPGAGMSLRKRKPVQAIEKTKKIRKTSRLQKSMTTGTVTEPASDHGRNILFTSACYRLRRKPTIKDLFPLRSVGGVLALFKAQLLKEIDGERIGSLPEPDLVMLSVVIGMLEEKLTNGSFWTAEFDLHNSAADVSRTNVPVVPGYVKGRRLLEMPVPTLHWKDVEETMQKFSTLIKESVDVRQYPGPTSRELIRKISEVIWSHLLRSYQRDRLHIQSIYSLMESSRLDAFGVAYAVVAACQVLDIHDVKLVLSEDHSWVEFGPEGESCEVTWHGKQGGDEKFGQSVPLDTGSWIYQNGQNLVCDLNLVVAALVTSINATTSNNNESEELATLQHQLLWFMHDLKLLNRFPMGIGTLADLEDSLMPDFPRREPIELFHEAIVSSKKYYNDSHVYPYTLLAGFHFRNCRFKAALRYWGDAAQIMKNFNHNRDDEEIYKEFQEIGNELIPYLVKFVSNNDLEPSMDHYMPHLEDPECFAFLLQFYDGLCSWEEGSQTPVLHIGWAKFAVASISKFSTSARTQVSIKFECSENDGDVDSDLGDSVSEDGKAHHASSIGERRRRRAASFNSNSAQVQKPSSNIMAPMTCVNSNNNINNQQHRQSPTLADDDLSEEDMNLSSNVSSDGSGTHVTLYSKKMAGLKNLLTATKLNTSAIQLQLTAQSQVNLSKRHRSNTIRSNSSIKNELDFVAITNTTLARTYSNVSSDNNSKSGKKMRRN